MKTFLAYGANHIIHCFNLDIFFFEENGVSEYVKIYKPGVENRKRRKSTI